MRARLRTTITITNFDYEHDYEHDYENDYELRSRITITNHEHDKPETPLSYLLTVYCLLFTVYC